MDKDTLKPISLAVRVGQLERLKTLSSHTGAPLAELIRRAIDAYLEEHRTMTEDAFKKTVKRTETAAKVTYDVRPFKDQQQAAVAWYLGSLIFKSSISSISTSKAVVIVVDDEFESTDQLDGFVQKLKAAGLSIEVRTA